MSSQSSFLSTNPDGSVNFIPDCFIDLGSGNKLNLYALPEISDSKQAQYSDQVIQGRSSPVKTYSYSSNRTISVVIHLYVTTENDMQRNLNTIRKIAALIHPEYEQTYLPPRIARIKCGTLLSEDTNGIPVVLKSYDIAYPTDVQWFYYNGIYMPLHVQISTQWDVVYSWTNLPGYNSVLIGQY